MKKILTVAIMTALMTVLLGGQVLCALTLNLATPDPKTSPITLAAEHLAELVNQKTNGDVVIKVFPDSVLFGGSPANAVKNLGAGSLDMLTLSTSLYASFEPKFTAISVPYMFKSTDQLVAYLNGEPGKELAEAIKRLNIVTIGYWTRPPRHVTNSKLPIASVADFKGLKLRVPNSPLWVEFFKAMGTSPVPMDFSEVYNALQLKTIDGQENPIGIPVSAKFYEVQKYISLTGHIVDGWVVGMNTKKWDALSADYQQAISEAVAETQQWKINYDDSKHAEFVQILKDNGMQVIELSDEAIGEIRAVAQSVYPKFKSLVGEEFFAETEEFVKNN